MNTGVNKDALIQVLQSENKNYRLMTVDMKALISSMRETIKIQGEQITLYKVMEERFKELLDTIEELKKTQKE